MNPIFEETYSPEYINDFCERGTRLGSSTQTYFFTTKTIGWINCDLFYNDPKDKVDLLATFFTRL